MTIFQHQDRICKIAVLGTLACLGLPFSAVIAQEDHAIARMPTQAQINQLAIEMPAPPRIDGPVFGTEPERAYSFPSKGRDLDDGVYWQVTGHSSGHKRDLSGTRFDPETGSWTTNRPDSGSLTGEARRLIWDMPLYAPATGVVLTCWRNAPDGLDPGEAGCGDNAGACTTPGGGNHVRIWIPEERRMIFLAHMRQGTVPGHLCPHDATHVEDWRDKSGAFGFNPDILVPLPFRRVEEGEFIGRVGNSGRSGGPHLHVQMRQCENPLDLETCRVRALRFNGARVAEKPAGRDIGDNEWTRLNGTLTVSSPRQIVLPDEGIGGLTPVPQDIVSLTQEAEGFAKIVVNVTNPEAPVSDFVWQKVEPPTQILEDQASFVWGVTASCASGVERIQMDGPGGTQTQNFPEGQTHVSGQFETQSFSSEELENICLDWAESESSNVLCNQAPEDCTMQEVFTLIGGVSGGASESQITITSQCRNGQTVSHVGQPTLELKCGAIPFGFLN